MTPMFLLLLFFIPWLACAATPVQDMHQLGRLSRAWLEQQATLAWPNAQAKAQIGAIDERLRLPACVDFRFSLPHGGHLDHNGSVQARCTGPTRWSLYLEFQLHLSGQALVAQRDLPARVLIGSDDLELRNIEFEQLPSAYLHSPGLAIGMRTTLQIQAGQPLLAAWLYRPAAIQAGQHVRIVARGEGFNITQEGNALNSAAAGELVRARTLTGRNVQGLAQEDGSILVQP